MGNTKYNGKQYSTHVTGRPVKYTTINYNKVMYKFIQIEKNRNSFKIVLYPYVWWPVKCEA